MASSSAAARSELSELEKQNQKETKLLRKQAELNEELATLCEERAKLLTRLSSRGRDDKASASGPGAKKGANQSGASQSCLATMRRATGTPCTPPVRLTAYTRSCSGQGKGREQAPGEGQE